MSIKGLKVGFCVCGSFCTFEKVIPEMERLIAEGADLWPIFSETTYTTDTRFFSAKDFRDMVEGISGKRVTSDIAGAEPIGPKKLLDIVVVAPCTGNTLGKLANGITDTSVTMACKAHLRNNRPLVIAISTNDGLGVNAKNLGLLLNTRNIYFVPFGQDDALVKSNSLGAKYDMLIPTIEAALEGNQIQPLLV